MQEAHDRERQREVRKLPWADCAGAGILITSPFEDRPEDFDVRSASHSGSVYRRKLCQKLKAVRLPPSAPTGNGHSDNACEDGLLYLAIYRDKVARVARANEEITAASAKARNARHGIQTVAAAADDSKSPSPNRREFKLDSDGVGDPQEMRGSLRSGGEGERRLVQGSSLNVRAAIHDVVAEHLEAKRLGNLYNEWRATQPMTSAPNSPAAGGASRRRKKIGDLKIPNSPGGEGRSSSKAGSQHSPTEAAVGPRRSAAIDRSRADRCLEVLTNSKRRMGRDVPVVSHIEGFPVLKHSVRQCVVESA